MNAGAEKRSGTQLVDLYGYDDPLLLDSGATLAPVTVAYETYGSLDHERGNAIVVFHALTGDAHATRVSAADGHVGWWETMIGPGKPVDTNRFFVVCANLLGGCSGTTGPSSIDPRTGVPYGSRFPRLATADLVEVQRRLVVDYLGVNRPLAAIGGSLGGMLALEWVIRHPEEMEAAAIICASARLRAENIAFSSVARHAILSDENFAGGDYYGTGLRPDVGLQVARMLAHITYVSSEALERKFARKPQHEQLTGTFGVDFAVESYLTHQGESFLKRFDANTYLVLTRLMEYFEPFARCDWRDRLQAAATRFLLVSFTSDWRFGWSHSVEIEQALEEADRAVEHVLVASEHGHDSFLLEIPEYHTAVRRFLNDVHSNRSSKRGSIRSGAAR